MSAALPPPFVARPGILTATVPGTYETFSLILWVFYDNEISIGISNVWFWKKTSNKKLYYVGA